MCRFQGLWVGSTQIVGFGITGEAQGSRLRAAGLGLIRFKVVSGRGHRLSLLYPKQGVGYETPQYLANQGPPKGRRLRECQPSLVAAKWIAKGLLTVLTSAFLFTGPGAKEPSYAQKTV